MSWVYYADRKPTEADADAYGHVICKIHAESGTDVRKYSIDMSLAHPTAAWLDPKLLPLLPPRKIWRTPTQADLDKATEPIPCRVRDMTTEQWKFNYLTGIAKFGSYRFSTRTNNRWDMCEIEVDA